MARHVSSFHIDLGQLWQCPVSWCSQWNGTPQDCVDHIQRRHSVNDLVKAASLERWFQPWTVTMAAWHKAFNPQVLFSDNGSQLVHHYWVFGQSVAHASLCGTFMASLQLFTVRACADAKWAAKHEHIQGTQSPMSSGSLTPLPHSIRPRTSDDDPQLVKLLGRCPRSSQKCRQEPHHLRSSLRSVLYGERQSILPISIPLRWRHSSTRRTRSPVLPWFVSTWMLLVLSVPGRVTVKLWCRRSRLTERV